MCIQLLHLKNLKAVGAEYALHRGEGQIGKKFVIDGVELVFPYQVQQMGKLEGGRSTGFQQVGESDHKIIDIRHMGQNVIGRRQVGLPAFPGHPPGQIPAEKLPDHRDSLGLRRPGSGLCGLYAQAGMPISTTYCNK